MCYLNPFEVSQDCSTIGDFDLYYQYILKDLDFDRGLFKNIMKYIDIILEQSEIPSFSILFNGFDANQQMINFDIEINTTKEDELKLVSRGIKNPHIFILTNLINLLKQSIFIIGSDIDTKTINITTRNIQVGNTSYLVNTSTKQFSLPIQKITEREIFDYTDIEKLFSQQNPISNSERTESIEITEIPVVIEEEDIDSPIEYSDESDTPVENVENIEEPIDNEESVNDEPSELNDFEEPTEVISEIVPEEIELPETVELDPEEEIVEDSSHNSGDPSPTEFIEESFLP